MRLSEIQDRSTALKLAAAVPCDVRTAARYLETPKPVALATAGAIRRALTELGIADPRRVQEVRP